MLGERRQRQLKPSSLSLQLYYCHVSTFHSSIQLYTIGNSECGGNYTVYSPPNQLSQQATTMDITFLAILVIICFMFVCVCISSRVNCEWARVARPANRIYIHSEPPSQLLLYGICDMLCQ